MKKLNYKWIAPAVFILAIMMQFQNCAQRKESQFEDSKVAQTLDFFEYRYSKATLIYFEVQVVQSAADDEFQELDLIGIASTADGSETSIQYSIELFNKAKKSICPVQTGTIPAKQSLFKKTCVVPVSTVLGSAVMKVKDKKGEWHVYTKKYN